MKCHARYATEGSSYNEPKSHCCKLVLYDFGNVNVFTATCFMYGGNWMWY